VPPTAKTTTSSARSRPPNGQNQPPHLVEAVPPTVLIDGPSLKAVPPTVLIDGPSLKAVPPRFGQMAHLSNPAKLFTAPNTDTGANPTPTFFHDPRNVLGRPVERGGMTAQSSAVETKDIVMKPSRNVGLLSALQLPSIADALKETTVLPPPARCRTPRCRWARAEWVERGASHSRATGPLG
jgi:hypothetical protein